MAIAARHFVTHNLDAPDLSLGFGHWAGTSWSVVSRFCRLTALQHENFSDQASENSQVVSRLRTPAVQRKTSAPAFRYGEKQAVFSCPFLF